MNALLPIEVPRLVPPDGRLLLDIRGDHDVQVALRSVACSVLPHWIRAGAAGGFGSAPQRPNGAALASPLDAFRQGASLALDVRALDARAFQILRSALLWHAARRLFAAAGVVQVEEEQRAADLQRRFGAASIVVRVVDSLDGAGSVQLPGADPASDESEVDLYPGAGNWRPFKLAMTPQPGRLRRCVVTFDQGLDALVLKAIASTIEPWVQLLELGGFEQPTSLPGTRTCSFGGVQIFDVDSAEIVVDRFDAAEGAWNVLANLLAGLAKSLPIVAVDVY
jgi:hypothetical protein